MKECIECGCLMPDDHESDICECCQDDRRDEEDPIEQRAETRIYIYDIEVFLDDWIVIFRNPEAENNHIVIHNDNYQLRAFLDQSDILIGGFNNKHYDDWIILTMYLGGSNVEVKRHNDFIISGEGEGWEFPFIQYQQKPFKSFDLRDDIADKGLSLKAIEGNMYLPIVESSVPFDIDHKLSDSELDEVIRYCEYDVDAAVELYKARADYLQSKQIVGRLYGVPENEALGLTNAKLSARVLHAKQVDRSDERDYQFPERLDRNLIPDAVYNFFMQIRDKSIPDTKLFGTGKEGSKGMTLDVWIETSSGRCPVTYAWGGVHGAKPAFIGEATSDRLIVNYDVSSMYPNCMINFGYCSRSMEDPKAYTDLTHRRVAAKQSGDKATAGALKLVVNTVYGAMLNQYNDLADRRNGRSVCITNQLAVTQLLVMLGRQCSSIDFININTDGVMFFIDKAEDQAAAEVISDWCRITGFETERTDFEKIIQKDVNNYIGVKSGGEIKTKGGYVSLYRGGDFKTNSLQIIHKAVVENLVRGAPPEETINSETDIFKFQNIVKTGSTYDGSFQYIGSDLVPTQNVNRIYAAKDPKYGQIVKRKWVTEKRKKDKASGKMISEPVSPHWEYTTISECPDHAIIDNENKLTVNDLDRNYYIRMAKSRITKYINLDSAVKRKIEKIKEVITIMATTKETETENIKTEELNVYQKLLEARSRFLSMSVKKSGKNTYAEFKYFKLEDIVPVATQIFKELGLIFIVSFRQKDGVTEAVGDLVNTDDPADSIRFTSPIEQLITNDGKFPNGMNSVQALGGTETYLRRYLYCLALDVVEDDTFDATQGKPDSETGKSDVKKNNRPASEAERSQTKAELIDKDGEASDTQIKAIKNGLKKLRAKDGEKYEEYVKKSVDRIKAGLKKTEAEDLLIEIGQMVVE